MTIDSKETKSNIEAGLAHEAVANRKYLYFAKLARELGDEEVAQLFETIAQEETAHAFAQLTLMYPSGSQTIVSLLQVACDTELNETGRKYPEYAQAAELERAEARSAEEKDVLLKAERRFLALATKEASHHQRFAALLKSRQAMAPEASGDDTPQ